MDSSADRYEKLLSLLREIGSAVVAFSGGVDSSLLLHAAKEALGDRVLAVTAVSPTYPRSEREEAVSLAKAWGVRHRLVESDELKIPGFSENLFSWPGPANKPLHPRQANAPAGTVLVRNCLRLETRIFLDIRSPPF